MRSVAFLLFRGSIGIAEKLWRQPKVWWTLVFLFKFFSVYLNPVVFTYILLVENYICSSLGPFWIRSGLSFALILSLGLLFGSEWQWNIVPRWQLCLHKFCQLEFNGCRSEPLSKRFWNASDLSGGCTRKSGAYFPYNFSLLYIEGKPLSQNSGFLAWNSPIAR